MGLLTFKGGIHPTEGKDLSKNKPIKEIMPKGELVHLMSQHIGRPAKPIVKTGDRVLAGQKIAAAEGFISAHIHSSVSGVVKKIEPRLGALGGMSEAIVIENDAQYQTIKLPPINSLTDLSKMDIIKRIGEAGIVGMGGAGFPAHIKLSPKAPDKIEYVIVNGAECEPYLTSDYRRMLEQPEKVIGGLKCILHLFEQAKGIIAIENNKPDCIAVFNKLLKDEKQIEVKILKSKYPQGAERYLINAVTGIKINSSMLPADGACIVHNIDTVVSIHDAIYLGRPVISRIVTVTGDAIKEPRNFLVKIGTSYEELISEAGGLKQPAKKIISGGPMMGIALFDLKVPVIKTSSALLCFKNDDVSECEESNCINCGKCAAVCPARLLPLKLADYANRHDTKGFSKYSGMECCECGCCSYICPAKRQLTQSIKSLRRMILTDNR